MQSKQKIMEEKQVFIRGLLKNSEVVSAYVPAN
jgi:hypothetical protein